MVFVDVFYLLVPSSSWFLVVLVSEINPLKHLSSVKPLLVDNFRVYYPPLPDIVASIIKYHNPLRMGIPIEEQYLIQ